MGDTVEFASNGGQASGYLATPTGGSGPGLIVLQEWWGLSDDIRRMCDRFASEGFTALAPDLYHGEVATHQEMDKAAQLMNSLPQERAARDMGGAADHLAGLDSVRGDRVGVVGYCMGGMLSLVLAAGRPDRIGAVVAYYGAPLGEGEPDWKAMSAAALGHFAEKDDFFPPDAVKDLESRLQAMGKDVEFIVYPGTGHAFASGHNALGTMDESAADQAWARTISFLHSHLDG